MNFLRRQVRDELEKNRIFEVLDDPQEAQQEILRVSFADLHLLRFDRLRVDGVQAATRDRIEDIWIDHCC